MKKALIVLAAFVFCTACSQIALANPTKATKASKPAKAAKPAKAHRESNSGLGLTALGVEAGLVDPEAAGSTIGFGAFANLGNIARDVRLSSHLGYWSKSENAFGAEASVRDISVGARAKYMFHVSSPKLQPYVGTGLGLHFFHMKAGIPGSMFEDSVTKLGFDLGGGVLTPVSPKTDLFGDVWYTVADIDQFSMKVGLAFRMNR